jgi:plasmid stability protein
MILHMRRTTLTIDDQLFRELKKRASEQGRTLQAVTNDLLRRSLSPGPVKPYRLQLRGWKAAEQPGVDLLDRDALFDLMDGR